MKKIYLHYFKKLESGCYGALMDNDGLPFAVTLQPDDKYFADGEYKCKKDFYHHGGYPTFEIQYPEHTRVLFHKGNWEKDSKLCVLVGENFAVIDGKPGIAASGAGFGEFWSKYKDEDEILLIVSSSFQ